MSAPGGNRSISIGGNVTGASIVTGDHNTSTVTYTAPPPPPAERVDPAAELASLRSLLAQLRSPDAGKMHRALEDALDDLAKPEPNREDIGSALTRAGKIARAADNFAEHAEKLAGHVSALSAWVGPAGKLLTAFGLSG